MTVHVVIIHPDPLKLNALEHALRTDRDIRIIAKITNSKDVLESIVDSGVDLILLNDQLDSQTGYKFIIQLMKTHPIVCLLINEPGYSVEVDYPRALDYGIVDTHRVDYHDGTITNPERMIIKIKILAKLNLERFRSQIDQINNFKPVLDTIVPGEVVEIAEKDQVLKKIDRLRDQMSISTAVSDQDAVTSLSISAKYNKIVILGASTGGPRMLVYIVSQLPYNFPPVVIVQHMPKGFVGPFATRMNNASRINVKQAEHGDKVLPGNVYIAPGGYHLEFERENGTIRIRIVDGPKVNYVKPAVDTTLFSAAKIYGKRAVAAILTGMGSDGKEGSRVLKNMGGRIIALNEDDSVIYGMNKAVIEAGLVDAITNLNGLVGNLIRFLAE